MHIWVGMHSLSRSGLLKVKREEIFYFFYIMSKHVLSMLLQFSDTLDITVFDW